MPNVIEQFKATVTRWKKSPYLFVKECIGAKKISNQQKELLDLVGDMVKAKLAAWRVRNLTEDDPMYPAARDFLKDPKMVDLSKKYGITVRSGKGCGKDTCMAWLIKYFLSLYVNAKIPCIAPTERSLSTILWPEVNKWYNMATDDGKYAFKFRDYIKIEGERIIYTKCPNPGKGWMAYQLVAAKQSTGSKQEAVLSGVHEDYMFPIFDEATGIDDSNFRPLENTMTGMCNFAFLIANPNRRTGFFADTHLREESAHWVQVHWDATKSDIVNPDSIERMKDNYGEASNNYRVNVQGEFPTDDSGSFISWDWVDLATELRFGDEDIQKYHPILGVDVALAGGDRTVIAIKQGPVIFPLIHVFETKADEIAERIAGVYYEHGAKAIYIDNGGCGHAVVVCLQQKGINVIPVSAMGTPGNIKCWRKRDECWFNLRKALEAHEIQIPKNNDLIQQLTAIKGDTSRFGGKLKMESKEDLKRREVITSDSPDEADAVSFLFSNPHATWFRPEEDAFYEDPFEEKRAASFMGV